MTRLLPASRSGTDRCSRASRAASAAALMLVCQLIFCSLVQSSQVEQTLYSRLINGPRANNRQLRPVKNHAQPVRVEVRVSVIDILGLDDNLAHVTVKMWLSLRWKDEYLMWNPTQYDGIRKMNMATGPDSKIWTPDITMFSALNTPSSSAASPDAVVTSDGTVTWVRPVIYTVGAQHDFRTNSWSSSFRFGSWSYDSTRIEIQPDVGLDAPGGNAVPGASSGSTAPSVRLDIGNFVQSDQFLILDSRGQFEETVYPCCPDESYSSVTYQLKIRKKSGASLLGRRGL